MKEERLAVLRMLENGVISADEAERLLCALSEMGNKKDLSESLNGILTKTGEELENIGKKVGAAAKTVGDKVEEKKPEIKKAAQTVKEKVGETAVTIKENIKERKNGEAIDDESEEKPETACETEVQETTETADAMPETNGEEIPEELDYVDNAPDAGQDGDLDDSGEAK